jgi:hypothetical protein
MATKGERTALVHKREISEPLSYPSHENRADATASDRNGQTVLHWAAQEGNPEVVRQFLENGADATASDSDRRTDMNRKGRGRG